MERQVFENLLKQIEAEVLKEMRSSSPDEAKIKSLVEDIKNTDIKLALLRDVVSPPNIESKSISELTPDQLAKVRWAYTEGSSFAEGCITINPNGCTSANNKPIYVFLALDVSNSMGDDPLIDLSNETIKMVEELLLKGGEIMLTLIAYGRQSNVFVDEVRLSRENYSDIIKAIKKNVGDPYMGNIRSDTRFSEPLSDMFERGSKYGDDSVYIWWSDGKENGGNNDLPKTDVVSLVTKFFPDGPKGKMCTATYKDKCGEKTQMQEMTNMWADTQGCDGFFANIDNIKAIVTFTKESLEDCFFSTMAKDIIINLPTGEVREIENVRHIPIDITFTQPVTLEQRVGLTKGLDLDTTSFIHEDITICFNAEGATNSTFVYKTIDEVQMVVTQEVPEGILVSSVNTHYAHKLKRFYELQQKITGLTDEAEKDLPLLEESILILHSAGTWSNDTFHPCLKAQGTSPNGEPRMINFAANHQRQAKYTYNDIETSIIAAKRIIAGQAQEQDYNVYSSATRSSNSRAMQSLSGKSQSGGYSAQVSAYGASNVAQDSDDDDEEEDDD